MKEKIYTIPINEAFDQDCQCPLCLIEKRLEKLNNVTLADVNESIENYFTLDNFATATVGPKRHALIV